MMDEARNDWSSSVSTSSLMSDTDDHLTILDACEMAAEHASPSERQKEKQRRRSETVLSVKSLEDLCVYTSIGAPPAYHVANVVHFIRGGFSQFTNTSQSNGLLPPMTNDCCQTFSALSAILLSSFGFVVMLEECWNISSVNYLVYLSAWLHQLTAPLRTRSRPTIGDLNTSLALQQFFPAKIEGGQFIPVLYDRLRVEALVRTLCHSASDPGDDCVCGYVIVSGQYTVSIFSLAHNVRKHEAMAWSLYLADSHGTLPWAAGNASVSCLSLCNRHIIDVDETPVDGMLLLDEGLKHFCDILCALLEDHRRLRRDDLPSHSATPYMTWTPIKRRCSTCTTSKEITRIIDEEWLPHVFQNPRVAEERKTFGLTHPKRCFWGQITRRTLPHSQTKPTQQPKPQVRHRHASGQLTLDRFLERKPCELVSVVDEVDIVQPPDPPNLVPPSKRRRL